jgi:ABC-type transport system involved in multi-copper enzyme maturation permease subunit
MYRLISAELLALRKNLFPWFCLALLAGFISAAILISYSFLKAGPVEFQGEALEASLRFPNIFYQLVFPTMLSLGVLLAISLCGMALGSDYVAGTIRLPIIRGESRWRVLGAKLFALLVASSVGTIISLAVGSIVGLLVNLRLHSPSPAIGPEVLIKGALTFFFVNGAIWVYIALTVLLVVVSRSPVVSLGLGFLIFFLEYIFSQVLMFGGGWIKTVRQFLLLYHVTQLTIPQESDSFPTYGGWSVLALLGYGLIFFLTSFYLFRRQDIQ